MDTQSATFVEEVTEGYCPNFKANHQIAVIFSKQFPPESIWKWDRFECDFKQECQYAEHCPIYENATSKILKLSR